MAKIHYKRKLVSMTMQLHNTGYANDDFVCRCPHARVTVKKLDDPDRNPVILEFLKCRHYPKLGSELHFEFAEIEEVAAFVKKAKQRLGL